jgi:7-cyano-7-deazaguanine synthase
MSKAVALLSGGLDSTVSLAKILADTSNSIEVVLTFDYGQRPRLKEQQAATAICQHYHLEHHVIKLDWLANLLPSGLQLQGKSHLSGSLEVKDVWVPNRNGVILNIAASWAEGRGATDVLFGANREEAEAGFPDNGVAYWTRLNEALALSTMNQVKVNAPVGHLYKKEIVALGKKLGIPFHLVWSCYEDGEAHCGLCASCKLLKAALEENGLPFPPENPSEPGV